MSKKLLLIEHNREALKTLTDLLYTYKIDFDVLKDTDNAFQTVLNHHEEYNAVIINRNNTNMNGMNLLTRIKTCSLLTTLPVLLKSDHAILTNEEIEAGIRAGARYYLPALSEPETVITVIQTAMSDQNRYTTLQKSISEEVPAHSLIEGKFAFRHLTDAHAVANFLSQACPNPRLAIVGISEILINAIEHGNLGISYEEKSHLQDRDLWLKEVERRLTLPENIHKSVEVEYKKTEQEIRILVTDQGQGFNWTKFQNIDSKRVFDNHGRGIVMAKSLVFERLEYHAPGNQVLCVISLHA
jgi:DNA-binding response OmpR family regulator